MRTVKAIMGMAITAIGMLGADISVGVWKRNIVDTKYASPNPNPITNLIMVREPVPGGLKITSKGHRLDGTPINYTVTVRYDGEDYRVSGIGSVFDTIALRQIDANTSSSITKRGKYHMTGLTVVSKDGKTMTSRNVGTDADGNPTSFTVVWDKQ